MTNPPLPPNFSPNTPATPAPPFAATPAPAAAQAVPTTPQEPTSDYGTSGLSQSYSFQYNGREVIIDLSMFGNAGAGYDAKARMDKAATLLNELTVLRAELGAQAHARYRELRPSVRADMHATNGKAPSDTALNKEIEAHPDYLRIKKTRDFVDYAWQITKDVHAPRFLRQESGTNTATFYSQAKQH